MTKVLSRTLVPGAVLSSAGTEDAAAGALSGWESWMACARLSVDKVNRSMAPINLWISWSLIQVSRHPRSSLRWCRSEDLRCRCLGRRSQRMHKGMKEVGSNEKSKKETTCKAKSKNRKCTAAAMEGARKRKRNVPQRPRQSKHPINPQHTDLEMSKAQAFEDGDHHIYIYIIYIYIYHIYISYLSL